MKFFTIFLLLLLRTCYVLGQTPLEYKWEGSVSSSWSNSQNWLVWDSSVSTWTNNSFATYPNSSTHTVTVDFTSAVTKTLSLDIATGNADVGQIFIMNNMAQACSFVIQYSKKLSVYNTFSVSGTNSNSITISCPSAIGGTGFGANLVGGGAIDFKPTLGVTINPIFSSCTYTNILIKVSGQGTTNFTENNLSFQGFHHELGNFNLNNLNINFKCAFMLSPLNTASDAGNINLLGSTINTQNVMLSNTALYNFTANTTTLNLNGSNTSSQFCEFTYKGDNLSITTSTVNSINIIGGKQVFFTSNFPSSCSKNVVINNLTTSEDLIFDAASTVTEYHIKNWTFTKPLIVKVNNGNSLISFKKMESITTAPSSCNGAYSFLSTPDQVDISTILPVTAMNMAFHNVKVSSGSITANNSVDIGYNTGIIFNTPFTNFGATTLTWNGSSDTKWNNDLNWTPNCIPTILTNVVIPSGTPNSPEAINCSAICYHFNTSGNPSLTIGARSALNIGGDFIRTSGAVIKPTSNTLYAQMYINLLGVLPNTNYNITSVNSNLMGCHLSIIANSNAWYSLTDDFLVNYPSVNNFAALVLYSGGLKTNDNGINAGSLHLLQSNVSAVSTRSLDIVNSIIRISAFNVGHSFYLHCPNTNVFNTSNSTIYFDKNLDAASDFNLTVYGLPTNNHLATPTFSLNRVIFNNQPSFPSVITLHDAMPNLTPQSGFKIKSVNAKGNVVINANGYHNLLNLDSLYVLPGYNLTGLANSSITINDYISSATNCQSSPFFIKSSIPGSLNSNQFYINTGPTITYTLNNWNIDAVKVNQASGGSPSITLENSILSGNTGLSPSNGWNTSTASGKVFYWIGEGATTNWTDLDNWSFLIPTNGDDPTAGCLPSVLDDVLFTNLSFYGSTGSTVNTTSVVTVNQSVFFKDMRWLGPFKTSISGTTPLFPTITNTISTTELNVYGSIRMHKTMKWDFGKTSGNLNNVNFNSTVVDTIEVQNNSFNGDIYFLGSGRYVVYDSLVLCSVNGSTYNTNINKGTIYHYNGEIDALGNKIFACAYNSQNNSTTTRRLNITNSKLYFIQVGVLGAGIKFGNTVANTYTLISTNSIINIKPFDDYCYTCGGAYNTLMGMVTSNSNSEPRLSFNTINVTSYSSSNTGYYIEAVGKGVDIDSLTFDVLKTHFLNTVATETNTINYLKYKIGSTNELTSGATTILKELDARSICDPITIQSTIVGSYSNLCPMSSTALTASETSLKYIHSACGAYVPTNYNTLNGSLCAFIPAGLENSNAWTINPIAPSLGFITNNSTTVTCGQLPFKIPTNEFNVSATTHTLVWQSASGNYTGTPTGFDLTTFTTSAAGVHTLTVIYKPGCLVTDTYTVNLMNDVTSVASTTNITCFGAANGSFSLTANTASFTNANYNYEFNPSTYTTNFASSMLPNSYSYTVTNTINPLVCKSTGTFVITEPVPLTTTISITSSVTCFGASTASVISLANGGTGSYSYNWTNGTNSYTFQNINNIPAGNYSLTITDANNCVVSNTVFVSEPAALPSITQFTVGLADCNNMNAAASYSVMGGTPAYQFAFTATNSAQSFTTNAYFTNGLSAGNNTLFVVDANGCETYTAFTVLSNTVLPVASFSISNTCINNVISINNTSSVSTGSISSYNWNFGTDALPTTSSTLQIPNGISYNVLGIKTITLSLLTDNGCSGTSTQTLLVGGFSSINLITNNSCNGTPHSFSVALTPNYNTTSTYTYNFGDGNSSTVISPSYIYTNAPSSSLTIYSATVSVLNNGCTSSATSTVLVYPVPMANFVSTNTCVNTPPHFFDASSSSVTGVATITGYNWIFGDNQIKNVTVPQTTHFYSSSSVYNVTLSVLSSNGCISVISKSVEVYPQPIANYTIIPELGSIIEPKVYFENQSIDYTKWAWSFGDGSAIDSTNKNVNHYYNSKTNNEYYTMLVVSNQYGCKDTAYRFFELKPDFVFYIPNAFSPNSDKTNELFTGTGIGIAKYEMWIYDRWGDQIYYTDEISKGWNGRKQGADIDSKQDVYVWKVELKDVFGKKHNYVGHVTLLR